METQVRSIDAMTANGSSVRAGPGSRHEDAAPTPTAPRFDPRTRALLEGPIMSTLLRLATPNVLCAFTNPPGIGRHRKRHEELGSGSDLF